jgi:peptide/nickel transport system substrate-binding protein
VKKMIMRPYKSRLLIGLGAICVLAIATACGGGAQEDAVTKEELRSVVKEAMAESAPAPAPAPAGPSAEEMRALVSEAVAAAAPAAMAPEEIRAMVEAAMAAFSADEVSGADIEKLVAKAVEDAVSQGPTPLSASEIEAIVGAAISAIPIPEQIVTVVTPTAMPAAPATAMAPPRALPASNSASGTLVVAISASGPGVGLNSSGPPDLMQESFGIGESLFIQEHPEIWEAPHLVASWTVFPDLTGVSLTVREGVQFHKGYGEMTAEDLAWNMNDSNAAVTPTSIHGQAGDFAGIVGEAVVTGSYTLDVPFTNFDQQWASRAFNQNDQGLAVFSKKAFDENGADWMRENIVATGPFSVVEWVAEDRIVVERFDGYWGDVANLDQVRIQIVPDNFTRKALLETGDADVAGIDFKDLPSLVSQGFVTTGAGGGSEWILWFAGNYWEKTHAITGEPIDWGQIHSHAKQHAWRAHPDDAEDMENARKVRNALAMAIDRDLMVETLTGGLGWPAYMGFFSANDSNWRNEWDVPYDPAEAERLLDEAGRPEKDGVRFNIPVYTNSETSFGGELADTIASFWRQIGADVEVQKYAYSLFRPAVVSRGWVLPQISACCPNQVPEPWNWPRFSFWNTTITRGGFGGGLEIPDIADFYQRASAEPDPEKRIDINNAFAEWMREWMLGMGTVGVPNLIVYNPNAIESWDMRPSTGGSSFHFNSLERITLSR